MDTRIKKLVVLDSDGQKVAIDLPASYVITAIGTTLADHAADTAVHVTAAEHGPLAGTNAADGLLLLNSLNKIPAEYIGRDTDGLRSDIVFQDIAERDIADMSTYPRGYTCFVMDASSDATVDAGWAIYRWDTSKWTKILEGESIDTSVWNGSWDTIIGKPLSSAVSIDNMVSGAAVYRVSLLTENPAQDIEGYV